MNKQPDAQGPVLNFNKSALLSKQASSLPMHAQSTVNFSQKSIPTLSNTEARKSFPSVMSGAVNLTNEVISSATGSLKVEAANEANIRVRDNTYAQDQSKANLSLLDEEGLTDRALGPKYSYRKTDQTLQSQHELTKKKKSLISDRRIMTQLQYIGDSDKHLTTKPTKTNHNSKKNSVSQGEFKQILNNSDARVVSQDASMKQMETASDTNRLFMEKKAKLHELSRKQLEQ